MNYEQNLSFILDILYDDLYDFIGTNGANMFLRFFWTENKKMFIKGSLKEVVDISGCGDDFIHNLKVLKACELISVDQSEEKIITIKTHIINKPSKEKKILILNKLLDNKLISTDLYSSIANKINESKEGNKTTKTPKEKTNDVDFEKLKPKKINPDTAPRLVQFYYQLMHDVFGGNYSSSNLIKEASIVKNTMEKNNDTPENTRKFFAFILNAAKEKNSFDKVSTLGLYPKLRTAAYQKLIVENDPKYNKFVEYKETMQTEDDIINNVAEIYKFYNEQEEKLSAEDISKELKKSFASEIVDKFLSGLK